MTRAHTDLFKCPTCSEEYVLKPDERLKCSPCQDPDPDQDEHNQWGALIRRRNASGRVVWQAAANDLLDMVGAPGRAAKPRFGAMDVPDVIHDDTTEAQPFSRFYFGVKRPVEPGGHGAP